MPSSSTEQIMDSGQQPSRSSTSEYVHPDGPTPLFDVHLKYISDSYLAFFQERKRIEEIYIESLAKLHKKVKALDSYMDHTEMNTARNAWSEVRDHCEREAQTRQAFLTSLIVDIITPLSNLRETQDRTRKRIKDDIRESTISYNEYAENTLPKLKRAYIRKCQEMDEYKAAANVMPSQPLSPEATTRTLPPPTSPPTVTAPQPLRPISRRPSGSHPASRNRSPSSTTALSDLAHQGKRQLNQLMTFLDKSNTVKDGLGGRADGALRSVRAKRDAEEADKEYRKGVHWLETLRIRRIKILEAGYNSLELFIRESGEQLKRACMCYTDTLFATATTQTQLSSYLRECVTRISPIVDVSVVSQRIPRLLERAVPVRVLYMNYAVGECNDLIFGVSLVDYAQARTLTDGEIPKIVRICVQEVDRRGLESEGIYRISGRHALVQELQRKIERDERAFKFNPTTDDVYVVSSLLKMYLRELPEPVFKYTLQDRIQHSEDYDEHKASNFALLRAKMRRLHPTHMAVLKTVIEHLARVAQRSAKNKMDVKNLAIVFGTVIFGEDEMPKGNAELLAVHSHQDTLMEDLIENAQILFDERVEAPLPPYPAGESPMKAAYGSSHTKVSTMPPPQLTPRREMPPPIFPTPDDFSPILPSHPQTSIHPSARSGQSASPVRSTIGLPPSPSEQTRQPPPPPAPIQGLPTPVLPPRPGAASPTPIGDMPTLPPRPDVAPETPPKPYFDRGRSTTSANQTPTSSNPAPPPINPASPAINLALPPFKPAPMAANLAQMQVPPSPTASTGSSTGRSPLSTPTVDVIEESPLEAQPVRPRLPDPPGSTASMAESFVSAVSLPDDVDTTPRLVPQSQEAPPVPFPVIPAHAPAASDQNSRVRPDGDQPGA